MDAPAYPAQLIVRRDGLPLSSTTTLRPAGANVLTISTAINDPRLPLTLSSTFVSAPHSPTHVTILRLGPEAKNSEILTDSYTDATPPEAAMVIHQPERCGYEHARHIVAWGEALEVGLAVDVTDALISQLQTL